MKVLPKLFALLLILALTVTGCAAPPAPVAGGGAAAAPAAAPAKTSGFTIGVSNTLVGNGWREQMICAIKAEATASGVVDKVIVVNRNGGPTEQIADLEGLISQGVDAIILNPTDRDGLNAVIEAAIEAGIRIGNTLWPRTPSTSWRCTTARFAIPITPSAACSTRSKRAGCSTTRW